MALKDKYASTIDIDGCVQNFTKEIFSSDDFGKFNLLMNLKGINIAMASGILTVLYPEKFTVYDFRVCQNIVGFSNIANISDPNLQFNTYLKYIEEVKKQHSYSELREIDKMLWGKSFYDELKKDLEDGFTRLKKNS